MNRVKVTMIGLGQWGPNLLRNLRDNGDAEIVGLCDANGRRLEEFRALHPGVTLTTSMDEALAIPADAVVLATPAGLHETHVRACLDAGRDVLVEKPLALSLDAARELAEHAESRGRILMTGHTFLYNNVVRRVGDMLREGTLGQLRCILAQRLSLGQIREDVNALWNLAPHDVSIILDWLGTMPTEVTARGLASFAGHRQEDFALCTLAFPNSILASIQVSWLAPRKVREMTLVGTERMLHYDDVSREAPLTLFHRGAQEVPRTAPDGSLEGYRLAVRQGVEEPVAVDHIEPLAAEIAHYIDCIRTRKEPRTSARRTLPTISVLEALDRSLKSGGAPVHPTPP